MTREHSNLVIGLFVTVGALLLIGTIIWLGASQYLKKGGTYVTFFDESVQGLAEDSAVKFRGVDVGRVKSIRVAADSRLIEVTMKLSLEDVMVRSTVAQLKTAGITGIVYVELELRGPGDRVPQLTFSVSHPVIPSRPSQIMQILSKAEEIIDEMRRIDFQGISTQTQQTLKGIEDLVSGPRIAGIISNVQSAATDLQKTMARLEQSVSEGKVDTLLDETKQTIKEARELITRMQTEIKAINLGEVVGRADQTVQGLAGRAGLIADEVRRTSENLRRATESLETLMEKLNRNPSLLLRSTEPRERDE
jgi:phospholipid/cholesterol/gamma-HCH transport system substrate-binding protein